MGFVASRPHSIPLAESPPPAPDACDGRDELIDEIVGAAEKLESIALIGAAGIGKTSIALAAVHHDRTKRKFGENRRFIRCDQFPASPAHFLARLSRVIGAGIETPEDLTSLRPFLSSKEILIILDNAESVLDPHGANEVYAIVKELSQFNTICLCITSRVKITPPYCTCLDIPALPIEAARDVFYRVYRDCGRSDIVNDLIRGLNFNPLSIKLLATTAARNAWDHDRLVKKWNKHRIQVLQTGYEGPDATIEISLTSTFFRDLGPNARNLLEVITCFPNGINTVDLNWLFPTIPERDNIFDKFHALSLTYSSDGFIDMLPPIRDYLRPRSPTTFPPLCAIKDNHSSSSLSQEPQSWNAPPKLPSIAPVCIGELTTIALVQYRTEYLIFDGEKIGSEEEWAPVILNYEYNSSKMQDAIHIRTPTSGDSRAESPRDEPLGVVEQQVASKLGPVLGKWSVRLEAKVRRGLLNVSSNKFLPDSTHEPSHLMRSYQCHLSYSWCTRQK